MSCMSRKPPEGLAVLFLLWSLEKADPVLRASIKLSITPSFSIESLSVKAFFAARETLSLDKENVETYNFYSKTPLLQLCPVPLWLFLSLPFLLFPGVLIWKPNGDKMWILVNAYCGMYLLKLVLELLDVPKKLFQRIFLLVKHKILRNVRIQSFHLVAHIQ